ncbi:MAG: hypothetical protein EB020_16165 [Proteobacteria bacterium]|nr:hypothetical protein [Pseudomonadota bacterium]
MPTTKPNEKMLKQKLTTTHLEKMVCRDLKKDMTPNKYLLVNLPKQLIFFPNDAKRHQQIEQNHNQQTPPRMRLGLIQKIQNIIQ